ncbi:NAD synthetase [Desulfurella amilsii]|uniref:NH(3)-dependent NAD(+) synthetase n=1 Tax=Desulfurella amilsii TaxID=1562698 RepID=A0A1X4XVL8_9BACT|nr:NAD+ synthase [Desulfurella amilsii]OSS41582.1 NAD synthetase [Desulfurella amilsii]
MDPYKVLGFNETVIADYLIEFLRDEIEKVGFKKAVVGLSGGIDSSLVVYLLKEALGKDNVYALIMPYRLSSKESTEDAFKVVNELGIHYKTIEITKMADGYIDESFNKVRIGNILARTRMIVLFDQSYDLSALVVGTSNKTELLLGYGTWYGDMASSLNPIGDLYKTQVRILSKHMDVPENIINKNPTADLWVGQSDEEELGFSYDEADLILYHLFDKRFSIDEVVNLGFSKKIVNGIFERVRENQFKRLPPIIAKVSRRSINWDFRFLRDWGQV